MRVGAGDLLRASRETHLRGRRGDTAETGRAGHGRHVAWFVVGGVASEGFRDRKTCGSVNDRIRHLDASWHHRALPVT